MWKKKKEDLQQQLLVLWDIHIYVAVVLRSQETQSSIHWKAESNVFFFVASSQMNGYHPPVECR